MDTLNIIYKCLEEHFHHSQLAIIYSIVPQIRIYRTQRCYTFITQRCYAFINISDNPSMIVCTNLYNPRQRRWERRNPDDLNNLDRWKKGIEKRTFDLNHPNCLQELIGFITPPTDP